MASTTTATTTTTMMIPIINVTQQQQQQPTPHNRTLLTQQQSQHQQQQQPSKRSVGFATIEIIELPYTVGDNPSVSCGAPISASWYSQKRTSLDLEFFEQYRPLRRNKKDLHLTKEARKELLLQSGHTEKDIQLAAQHAMRTKQQRLETIQEIRSLLLRGKFRQVHNGATATTVAVAVAVGGESLSPLLQPLASGIAAGQQQSQAESQPKQQQQRQQQRQPHLPPSPIIPKRSPARMSTTTTTTTTTPSCNHPRLPHLHFPKCEENVLSPRMNLPSKRPAPRRHRYEEDAGTALFSHAENHTPKRLRSPHHQRHHHHHQYHQHHHHQQQQQHRTYDYYYRSDNAENNNMDMTSACPLLLSSPAPRHTKVLYPPSVVTNTATATATPEQGKKHHSYHHYYQHHQQHQQQQHPSPYLQHPYSRMAPPTADSRPLVLPRRVASPPPPPPQLLSPSPRRIV